jgi:branched-chain amino acid transport system permease protein
VLAAPIYAVSPLMGSDIVIVVFAVVVIGGMGSIVGSIISGVSLGVLEGLTKAVYPQASSSVIFVMMIVVLLIRPAGLFGWEK